MGKKNRVPGGKKNKKSGTKWLREEVEEIFQLYLELEGERIHETNEKIIKLGKRLGRTTRSVEAQLLMFRSLDRDEDYGHSNMNKFTKHIWNEHLKKIMMKDSSEGNNKDIRKWAGHRESGVSVAFTSRTKSNEDLVETKLIHKLSKLVHEIKIGNCKEKAGVFLLGGPGNGKTEALNYFFEKISNEVSDNDEIEILLSKEGQNYERELEIDLTKESSGLLNRVRIVQDATVAHENKSAGECFINDVRWLIENEGSKSLLFVCINRGILQDAIQILNSGSYNVDLLTFINAINDTQHISPHPENTWPLDSLDSKLEKSPLVYVWPMEKESLFLKPSENKDSPAEQAIHLAFRKLGEKSGNNIDRQLQGQQNIEYLVKLFRVFEIKTGRNISMREWFSLMVQAILGNEKNQDKRGYIWDEAFQQYPSRLFPFYPDFSSILSHQHSKAVFQAEESGFVKNFFKDYQSSLPQVETSEISNVLKSLELELETGRAWEMDISIEESNFSYQTFDRKVATSIADAEEYLNKENEKINLSNIDYKLLGHFSKAEAVLQKMEDTDKALAPHLSLLQNALRKLFSLYIYRALSVRNGISIHSKPVKEYEKLCGSEGNDLRRNLKKAFKDFFLSNQRLSIDMARTFGQPINTEREVLTLEVSSNFSVNIEVINTNNVIQPTNKIAFLVASINSQEQKDRVLPITYRLFEAIYQQMHGLNKAMVPREVHAQLERLGTEISQATLSDRESFMDTITIKGSQDPKTGEEIDMEQLLYNLKKFKDGKSTN